MNINNSAFITGWFRAHGIAYLDLIVKALDDKLKPFKNNDNGSKKLYVDRQDQYELAPKVGLIESTKSPLKLKNISTIHYLLPKSGHNRKRIQQLIGADRWKGVLNSIERTNPPVNDWKQLLACLKEELDKENNIFPDKAWFEKNWGEWGTDATRLLWHIINDAPSEFQVDWYKTHSAIYSENKVKFHPIINDDYETDIPGTTRKIQEWLHKESLELSNPYINLWGTATSIQFAWYYLAWKGIKLKNATFLFCKTLEKEAGKRFPDFAIEEADKSIIHNLSNPIPPRWESKDRQDVKRWLKAHLECGDNFCILLLGPRGSGKTHSIEELCDDLKKDVISANCANFSDPTIARSELFGHAKGAFTGANAKKKGLFERAHGKILFLDEIHHLDKTTRHMLLTALQTNKKGDFSFTPLGADESIESKFQLVIGSNLQLEELKQKLELDFFDRISQRILIMPALDKNEVLEVWSDVWDNMKFNGEGPRNPIDEKPFKEWLIDQRLPGNFRDLERIAITVADYQRARTGGVTTKTMIGFLNHHAKLWAIGNGEKSQTDELEFCFDLNIPSEILTENNIIKECKKAFAIQLKEICGSQRSAVDFLNKNGSKMNQGKFSNWINGK